MKITRPIVLAVLLATLVTAGCAGGDDTAPSSSASDTAAPVEPAPVPSTPDPSVPATKLPATKLPDSSKQPPGEPGAMTISGKVSAGVEPGCVLLTGPGGSHLLIFDDPEMKARAAAGAEVIVTGRAEPSMMTTCQQGTPFVVTEVRPA